MFLSYYKFPNTILISTNKFCNKRFIYSAGDADILHLYIERIINQINFYLCKNKVSGCRRAFHRLHGMGRILAIDLGKKRTGLAVTDPLKIIASPLDYVSTNDLAAYLKAYIEKEQVEAIVVGIPKRVDNSDSEMTQPAKNLVRKLESLFPAVNIFTHDERFTSKMALNSMLEGGMKKKDRRIKGNVDKISAAIILQSFLENKKI